MTQPNTSIGKYLLLSVQLLIVMEINFENEIPIFNDETTKLVNCNNRKTTKSIELYCIKHTIVFFFY